MLFIVSKLSQCGDNSARLYFADLLSYLTQQIIVSNTNFTYKIRDCQRMFFSYSSNLKKNYVERKYSHFSTLSLTRERKHFLEIFKIQVDDIILPLVADRVPMYWWVPSWSLTLCLICNSNKNEIILFICSAGIGVVNVFCKSQN